MLFSLLMTEVVTPSGKGCSCGSPVATEIRSRVQLFCGSENRLYEVTSCCAIPLGMDETPGHGPHVDEGSVLLSAVDWIAVSARTRRNKGVAHLGHAWRADQCTLCERS